MTTKPRKHDFQSPIINVRNEVDKLRTRFDCTFEGQLYKDPVSGEWMAGVNFRRRGMNFNFIEPYDEFPSDFLTTQIMLACA